MKHMETKKAKLKWIIIVELIVFYFSLLNVISHARGPVPYQIDTSQPVVRIEDFVPMAGMGVDKTETALPFYNAVEGAVAGYSGALSLKDVECLSIQFQIECPTKFAGNTLIVDLYNYESNYDNPEQEYHVVLQEGFNEISIELSPGDAAPETGELRFFTVNLAEYQIEGLKVYEKIAMPKITTPMWIAVLVFGFLLGATLIYTYVQKRGKYDAR